MARHRHQIPHAVADLIAEGTVIPAHPLALTSRRELDPQRQKALTRYYLDAGAGGLAVGVHTTQFAIREAGLYEPVLSLAMETATAWTERPVAMIAGLAGRTEQACREAEVAAGLGYHAGLLSLAAFRDAGVEEMLEHCRAVAERIPLFGFYLQTAVGGVRLPVEFWRAFAAIDNVIGIKMAPFNRYQTLDVVRGVAEAGAAGRVALYTGNDDHIVADLLTPFAIRDERGAETTLRIVGGLLGHWCVWTSSAVAIHRQCRDAVAAGAIPPELLALDARVTECNAAVFDVANDFAGVICGVHEILRRQGLLEGTWCLDPHEALGPGQAGRIDAIYARHGDLADDAFVAANLERWLA
jgi:dihydrodipicolinate synthase/N-acetylneuraminate lyase